jgi:alkylation response protein AidB-like acyl-CoA dehydrogenase
MAFALTPEQDAFAAAVRTFATRELAAGAVERAHAPAFPWDVAKA